MATRKLLTEAAPAPHYLVALSLVLTLVRKAGILHPVDSSVLTSGINGVSLLNLQQLMVFILAGEN